MFARLSRAKPDAEMKYEFPIDGTISRTRISVLGTVFFFGYDVLE